MGRGRQECEVAWNEGLCGAPFVREGALAQLFDQDSTGFPWLRCRMALPGDGGVGGCNSKSCHTARGMAALSLPVPLKTVADLAALVNDMPSCVLKT